MYLMLIYYDETTDSEIRKRHGIESNIMSKYSSKYGTQCRSQSIYS